MRENEANDQMHPTGERYEQLPIEEKLFFNIHSIVHVGKIFGGKGGQGRILSILLDRCPIQQRELIDIVGIQSGSLSEVLGKLESAGYIERSHSTSDRRGQTIVLTDAGRAEAVRLKKERGDVRKKLFEKLSDEEKSQLLSLLETVQSEADRLIDESKDKKCE